MAPCQAGVYLLFAGEQVVRVSEAENLREALELNQEFYGGSALKPTHFAYSVILDGEIRLQQLIEIIRFLSPTAQSLEV